MNSARPHVAVGLCCVEPQHSRPPCAVGVMLLHLADRYDEI